MQIFWSNQGQSGQTTSTGPGSKRLETSNNYPKFSLPPLYYLHVAPCDIEAWDFMSILSKVIQLQIADMKIKTVHIKSG